MCAFAAAVIVVLYCYWPRLRQTPRLIGVQGKDTARTFGGNNRLLIINPSIRAHRRTNQVMSPEVFFLLFIFLFALSLCVGGRHSRNIAACFADANFVTSSLYSSFCSTPRLHAICAPPFQLLLPTSVGAPSIAVGNAIASGKGGFKCFAPRQLFLLRYVLTLYTHVLIFFLFALTHTAVPANCGFFYDQHKSKSQVSCVNG